MSSYWDDEDDPDDLEGFIPGPNLMAIAGTPIPGIVELPEGEPGRKLDKKNAAGLEGATQTWQGYEPPEIKVTVRMWRASHRVAWRKLLPQILPRPGKPPATPFSIIHESLLDYGITQVLIEKISLPKRGKSQGEVEVTITMSHYIVPSKTGTSTPKAIATGPATVHERKGGSAPALIGPPTAPVPPDQFNVQPPK